MNRIGSRASPALIALNAALLLVLGIITLAPESYAQRGQARVRGDYTMVSGRIVGGSSNVVYIIDAANQELIAVRWSNASKGLDGVGFRSLQADGQTGPGR
jgi:hypothetical protein